jgi:hypothetical protein
MLGGCSSINAMMFHAGAPSDYDEWAEPAEPHAATWAYKHLKKYFLKFETFTPSALFPDVDPLSRGNAGPVQGPRDPSPFFFACIYGVCSPVVLIDLGRSGLFWPFLGSVSSVLGRVRGDRHPAQPGR